MRRFIRLNGSVFSLAAIAAVCGPMINPVGAQQPGRYATQAPQAQYSQGQAAQGRPVAQGQAPAGRPATVQNPSGQIPPSQNVNAQSPDAQNPNAQNPAIQNAAPQNAGPVDAAGIPIVQGANAGQPVAPFPPLNAQWQAYLDKVLATWEEKSAKVDRYSCNFKRFQYDPTLVQTDAYTVAAGVVKYMKPDKGLFRVDQLVYYSGRTKDNKPDYKENERRKFGEYWICDGKYVHILDQNEKKCTKHELPPNMRGNSIYLSPLPFLFGVKADDIKERYWIRPLQVPAGRKNEVWLEAYPRRADDAANYQRVQVVLDLKDWMPMGLIVFLPNWRPNAQHVEQYEFENREINAGLLQRMFQQEFIPAEPPKDWTVIIEKYQPEQPAQGEPRVATPPDATAPVR